MESGISPVECPQIYGGIIRTGRIAYSLRTKSIRDARVRAMSDAAKLDTALALEDLSAKIAIDPLILLNIEIVDGPYSMAVRLAP